MAEDMLTILDVEEAVLSGQITRVLSSALFLEYADVLKRDQNVQ